MDAVARSPDELSIVLEELREGRFGFIDAGSSTGGSLLYCEEIFGRGKGVGFDSNAEKIEEAAKQKVRVVRGNLTSIQFSEKCVSFSSMMDFLEHLPNQAAAEKVLLSLARASRDFLFIRHPSFEDIGYLEKYGLRLSWTNWSGHKNMMTIADFKALFQKLGWSTYHVVPRNRVADSAHNSIVPLSAPTNVVTYDPECHDKKEFIQFEKSVFGQYDIYVRLGGELSDKEWSRLVESSGI